MDSANEKARDASVEKTFGEPLDTEGMKEKDRHLLVYGEDRLLFLADAVFAIAMTLLVLEINLPPDLHDEGHFNAALQTLIAQTISYLITFAVLARYWIEHRSMMRLVDRLDTPAIWLTFLFLAFVAFFPVPSGILGDYDYTAAVVLFTLVLVGCGVSLLGLWLYIGGRGHLLRESVSRRAFVDRGINLSVAPAFFVLSLFLLPIGRFDPSAIFLTWLLLFPLSWLIHRLRQRR